MVYICIVCIYILWKLAFIKALDKGIQMTYEEFQTALDSIQADTSLRSP